MGAMKMRLKKKYRSHADDHDPKTGKVIVKFGSKRGR